MENQLERLEISLNLEHSAELYFDYLMIPGEQESINT